LKKWLLICVSQKNAPKQMFEPWLPKRLVASIKIKTALGQIIKQLIIAALPKHIALGFTDKGLECNLGIKMIRMGS